MAFQANKQDFARRSAVEHLSTILHAYIDGREKLYAVNFAVSEIRALFGESAALPLRLVARAVALDPDNPQRLALVTEAVQMVERMTRGDFD